MKRIVCSCSPFSLHQKIRVISDNLITEEFLCETKILANTLVEYAYGKQISNIIIEGNKYYLENIIKNIYNIEQSKYNKKFIKIDII